MTDVEIPDGAVYLWSGIEEDELTPGWRVRTVWHYFLVDVEEEKQ